MQLRLADSSEPLSLTLEWRPAAGGLTGFSLRLDGEALDGEGRATPEGEGILRLGERVLAFYAARVGGELHLWLAGEVYRFAPGAAEQDAPGASDGRAPLPPGGAVGAPMPGRVLKVLVEEGETVAAQEPLVVLESMKIELTVPAPTAGRVVEVGCAPGQLVDVGSMLVRLEET